MSPQTPAKKRIDRHSPYNRPTETMPTPVKTPAPTSPIENPTTPVTSPLLPSSQTEPTFTFVTNPSPTSLWVENTASSVDSPFFFSSPRESAPDRDPPSTQPKPYVINFGKHRGKLLSELPEGYIPWIMRKIGDGWFSQALYDDLKTALADEGYLESETISGPLLADWTPPPLDSAPSIFHEDITSTPLQISESDMTKYFKLSSQYIEALPKAEGSRHGIILNAEARYYLFHVYDLVEKHASEEVADRALEKFLTKDKDRSLNVYGI